MSYKIFFLGLTMLLFTACGGGGGGGSTLGTLDPETAISYIEEYADDGTNVPTLDHYVSAGITGVTQANLNEVNAHIQTLTATEVDATEKIQAIIDGLGETAISYIEEYADDGTNVPTLDHYVSAGITGVTQANLNEVNAHIQTLTATEVDTTEKIQAIIQAIIDGLGTDNTALVITLTPGGDDDLFVGEEHEDVGATAKDAKGNTIDVTVQSTDVNTSKAGIYSIVYTAVDAAGNAETIVRLVIVREDNTAPVIILNPGGVDYLLVGGTHTDAGAVATDDKDGPVEVIVESTNVDTTEAGTYMIVYTAVDAAGNRAFETRIVIVDMHDVIAPVITLNPGVDDIFVNEVHRDAGATAEDDRDGDVNVTVESTNVNIRRAGRYSIVYTAVDAAGNRAFETRIVIVKESDLEAPSFTSDSNVTVAENRTSALILEATDTNSITYSISGGHSASFDVNATTGVVTFKVAPDFETLNRYTFTATARDSAGNQVTQEVTINISNDNVVNNDGVNYETVLSPYTGKVWLDRNLGAAQVCESRTDTACYGYRYQWGRGADGHEKGDSNATSIQATDINNVGVGNAFITGYFMTENTEDPDNNISIPDWAYLADSDGSLRAANWSKTDGTSVCPRGFRVPSILEIEAETTNEDVSNSETAFNIFLKLPSAGYRGFYGGILSKGDVGSVGYLWSSTPSVSDASPSDSRSHLLYFATRAEGTRTILANRGPKGKRIDAISVRCLED